MIRKLKKKNVSRSLGGRLAPVSNQAADGGHGIGSLSCLFSFIIRLIIIAVSTRRLSSEAANSNAASTASPLMSAA